MVGIKSFKSIYVYFLSYFFNAAISFATVSLLTHHLSPKDYGIINLYSSFIILITPFVSGGVLYPMSVGYFKKPENEYPAFFTGALAVTLVGLLILTTIFFVFNQAISHFLRVTPVWVIILPLVAWWIMINEITMTMFRQKNKPWGFAFVSSGRNIAEVLVTIGLVIGLGWAWEGRLLAATIIPVLLGIISIYLFYKWKFIVKAIRWKEVRNIAWISVPFIFERLSIFVLSNSDRYFIDKYDLKGTEQVGLYSVGAQVAAVVGLVILSVNGAYQPFVFKNLAEKNKEKVKKGTGLYILATGVMVIMLLLGTHLLFRFFIGKEFRGGQEFAYYLISGYFMWGVYNAFLAYLLFYGKNRLVFYLSLTGMICSVILNFCLVPRYGAYGAAITSLITYTIMGLLCIRVTWKYFK